jgi:hypothetical protein
MDDLRCRHFFREPQQPEQRRYEALRAYFLDRRSLPDVARQFGFAHGTLRNLVCQFRGQCQAEQVPPFSLPLPGDDRPAPVPTRRARKPRPSPTAACWR